MRRECHGLRERQGWWHDVGRGDAVAAVSPGGTRAGASREVLPQPLCQEPQEQGRGKHSANLGEQNPGAGSTQGFASLGCSFLSFPSEKAPSPASGLLPGRDAASSSRGICSPGTPGSPGEPGVAALLL